jgi:hypothetical protein
MHFIFLKEERERHAEEDFDFGGLEEARPLYKTAPYFFSMVGILVFANWAKPSEGNIGPWMFIYNFKWWITGLLLVSLIYMLFKWFKKAELKEWTKSTWDLSVQILPLLLGGVLVSGFFLGRVGHEGIIPSHFVAALVGGNSLFANFFASIVGAFMYFATLTEVPILQGLIGSGMGKGPALALLLAGPALSLPSMLVIRSAIGTKKTVVFISLVVIMATVTGMIFGTIVE